MDIKASIYIYGEGHDFTITVDKNKKYTCSELYTLANQELLNKADIWVDYSQAQELGITKEEN